MKCYNTAQFGVFLCFVLDQKLKQQEKRTFYYQRKLFWHERDEIAIGLLNYVEKQVLGRIEPTSIP